MTGFLNLACLMKQIVRCHRVIIINANVKFPDSEIQYASDFDKYIELGNDIANRVVISIKRGIKIPTLAFARSDIILEFNDDQSKVQFFKYRYPMLFDGTIIDENMNIDESMKHECISNLATWYNIGNQIEE